MGQTYEEWQPNKQLELEAHFCLKTKTKGKKKPFIEA